MKGGAMSKTQTAKARVSVQALVTERHRDLLINKARKEGISLSELVRRMIEEVIQTYEDAKRSLN